MQTQRWIEIEKNPRILSSAVTFLPSMLVAVAKFGYYIPTTPFEVYRQCVGKWIAINRTIRVKFPQSSNRNTA